MEDNRTCSCNCRNIAIVAVLALAVAGVLVLKASSRRNGESPETASVAPCCPAGPGGGPCCPAVLESNAVPVVAPPPAAVTSAVPRLVDLGSTKCIPCKMMAPILDDLRKTYAGTLDVQFIDVWENPDAGKQYSINVIPTQIFYDAAGKELFRHEGFIGKDDILAKWTELGVELTTAAR